MATEGQTLWICPAGDPLTHKESKLLTFGDPRLKPLISLFETGPEARTLFLQ